MINHQNAKGIVSTGNLVRHFRDLKVYQMAFQSALELYKLSKTFPSDEKFSLVDQIRRSSRSVCANMAEAWRKRRYPASFVAKLSDAEAEAAETQVWLEFSLAHNYIDSKSFAALDDTYDHILAMIVSLINEKDKWTVAPPRRNAHAPKRPRADTHPLLSKTEDKHDF